MSSLKNQSILVTGGTGSFGKKFIETVLAQHQPKRLVVYSRDELKQFEMAQVFPVSTYPQIRYFIGDVRDGDRFRRACEGIDIIIHAAALKQVPAAEYNPMECIKTNVLGAENVINAALDTEVRKVVALSTDKAAAPINLYGATKLCSDKLFTITHPEMTRFSISLDDGVNMVLHALDQAWGGEVFVPRIPSYRITDVATAIGPDCKQEIIGIRPGEKLHEEMITASDSFSTLKLGKYFVICPATPFWDVEKYCASFDGAPVEPGFTYNSGTNEDFLTVEQIREQIQLHVDPGFNSSPVS